MMAALLAGNQVKGTDESSTHTFDQPLRALDENDENLPDVQMRVTISERQGAPLPLRDWEWVFSDFSKNDNFENLVENSMRGYYHDTHEHMGITAAEIVMENDSLRPDAEVPFLTGTGYIYRGTETLKGDLVTYTDEILTTVKLKVEILNPDEVRPVLRDCN